MGKNIIADHAKWPRLEDAIFKISGECKIFVRGILWMRK